jgi:DNA-binding NtrC family response regulator
MQGIQMQGEPSGVLIACSDAALGSALTECIRKLGHGSTHVSDVQAAARVLSSDSVNVLICGRTLDGGDGLDFMTVSAKQWPSVRRVFLTDPADPTAAAVAVNRARANYLLDPTCSEAALTEAIGAGPQTECSASARREVRGRRSDQFPGIIGESVAIVQLLDLIEKVARTSSTALVTGETGTGKELIGRAIHDASQRRDLPFAAINSAAIPETLLESELFGHQRGAFTGATSDAKGLFESADSGTVFLDEVGEMPMTMQAKLLRFLQTGEVRPVGAAKVRQVDVRLVAATNRRLEEEVIAGNFREDLYYRLAVIPIEVPPLRDRLEDIPLLADHFLRRLSKRYNRPDIGLDDSALDVLIAHDWPGNVRELENVIERGVALAKDDRICESDLPQFERRRRPTLSRLGPESLPAIERRHIIETLEHVGWNRKRAAEILEISTTTLWRRLKDFGIEPQGGRPLSFSE